MYPTTKKYILDDPIVFERRSKKEADSDTMRDAQEIERHLSRAAHRTIRAADKGMSRYRKARKKSAEKNPDDGPIIDFIPNTLKGSAAAMRELSLVPIDLLRAAYTPQARKLTRRTIRAFVRTTDDIID